MSAEGASRYAPSPSGDLHIGNLRTALLAWLFARASGRQFLLRIEDLDESRASNSVAHRQIADLVALGIDFDGHPQFQSDHVARYDQAIDYLTHAGMTFECFCSRRDVQTATRAPHAPPGAYPGTCRNLSESDRASRRRSGRSPTLRFRSDASTFTVRDQLCGEFTGAVDDFVLRRADGVAAYNLAVVVDDADSGVDQVVRADDLLSSAPRQACLATRLGWAPPQYAHVPLVLNTVGVRLAKRDGAVTLTDLALVGVDASMVMSALAVSLRLATPGESITATTLLDRFEPAQLPAGPWILDPADLY